MRGATLFLSEKEVQHLVKKLAKEIEQHYQNTKEPLLLVCPLKGSLFFLADLVRYLKIPVQPDFISIESQQGGFHILKDIQLPLQGHHVLIVKEVVNEGRKLLFLKKHLEAGSPQSVKIVALLDKPSGRYLELTPDFSGQAIDDRYIFGYGMDLNEKHRGLRGIFHFTQ
ncbi:MAG: phosphoribosyltransferase family protein [Bdellovibrionales bacterium]|nr:phosphoribosyltransferase family protein [Bdellovibrionales bacterium]